MVIWLGFSLYAMCNVMSDTQLACLPFVKYITNKRKTPTYGLFYTGTTSMHTCIAKKKIAQFQVKKTSLYNLQFIHPSL